MGQYGRPPLATAGLLVPFGEVTYRPDCNGFLRLIAQTTRVMDLMVYILGSN